MVNNDNKTLRELFNEAKEWNAAYRQGNPIVSDAEYDARIEALKNIDPENPWFKSMEPAPVKESRKRKLPIPMKSLEKAKNIADLKTWKNNIAFVGMRVVIMPKFDGLSLLYDETTKEAFSRGGSENEGQDCSAHCAWLTNIENKSRVQKYHYTFGEFTFSRKKWDANFKDKANPLNGEKYKSPRNTAAGLLNRDSSSSEIAYVDFYRYGMDDNSLADYQYFSQALKDLCEDFGQKPLYEVASFSDINDQLLERLFKTWASEYFIDGLVIYVDNLDIWKRIGRHPNGNPAYAIAYKHPDFTDTFEAEVLDVNWKVSKAGALKPTVRITDVDTGDCVMNNPTGNNYAWLKERKIAKGAQVLVTRSGGVIPKILTCLRPASTDNIESLSLKRCPSCGSRLTMGKTGIDLMCPNPECKGRLQAKLLHFMATCEVEGMGEDTIAKLFASGFDTVAKILWTDPDQLMKVNGLGPAFADTLYYESKRLEKGISLPVLMHASDCFYQVGRVKAEKALNEMTMEDVEYFCNGMWDTMQPMIGTPEFDRLPLLQKSLIQGYRSFFEFITNNRLKFIVPKAFQKTNDAYDGFFVCFSGIRDLELEERIKLGGGRIVNGVTKHTTHLIVKDPDKTSCKINRAKELEIQILTIDDFKRRY